MLAILFALNNNISNLPFSVIESANIDIFTNQLLDL